MTAADWGILIPAIVSVLAALAAWLNARTSKKASVSARNAADSVQRAPGWRAGPPAPPGPPGMP